jgi:hypothetical protein
MNNIAKLLIAAAAVVVVAVVGINLLPGSGSGVGGPAVPPSPSPVPSPSPSPSPSPAAGAWTSGDLTSGPLSAELQPCDPRGSPCNKNAVRLSLELPTSTWTSSGPGDLQTGEFETSNHAWILFMGPIRAVSTDPCARSFTQVGPSVDEMATAVTTIGGTDAVGPTDITVGGLPGQLVTLTIHDEIACERGQFWLFGDTSLFPNTLESSIKLRFLDVGGEPFVIYSDQDRPNPELEREIQQIVDSIQFE